MDDATRFQQIRNRVGVVVEHISTRRTFDTTLKLCGVTLATRCEVLKRGKVASTVHVFYER